jgi:hypothetical protein
MANATHLPVRGSCEGCAADQKLADEHDVRVCTRCGGRVRAEGTKPAERRHASAELLRAASVVRVARVWYGASALVFLGQLIAAIQDLGRPTGAPGFQAVALGSLLLLASVAGFQLAPRHPFGAALTLTLIGAVSVVASLIARDIPFFGIVLTAGFVGCALATRGVERTLGRYPHLLASRQMLGVVPNAGAPSLDPRAAAARRAWRRAGVTAALELGLVLLAATLAWRARPRELDAIVRTFTEAWNRSGLRSALAFFPEDERDPAAVRFEEELCHIPHWPYEPPKIEAPARSAMDGDSARSSFALEAWPETTLEASWKRTRGVWCLADLRVERPPGG